jgi:hemerythrin superfamily protein
MVEREHREVERLFARFELAWAAEDRREQGALVREIVRALSMHAAVEEQVLYPALRATGLGLEDEVLDALEQHHAAKVTMAELAAMQPGAERYAPKVRLLAESVRLHVAEEERTLLPRLRDALDEAARRELGTLLQRARRTAPTRPHPAAPDTPPANLVAGPVAALLDRSRDALREGAELVRAAAKESADRGVGALRGAAARVRRGGGAARQAAQAARATAEVGRIVADRAAERAGRLEHRPAEAARQVRPKAGRPVRRKAGRPRAAAQGGAARRPRAAKARRAPAKRA